MARAVCRQRSSGLVTTATRGTTDSRSAVRSACATPVSSSRTPAVRPARTPEVLAVVRPCRTKITVATDARVRPLPLTRDRRQRALPQGPAHGGRLLPARVRQDARRGHRGGRLRLGG